MRSFPTHLRISNRNACHTNTVTSRAKCVLPNKLAVKEVHELLDKRHHRLSLNKRIRFTRSAGCAAHRKEYLTRLCIYAYELVCTVACRLQVCAASFHPAHAPACSRSSDSETMADGRPSCLGCRSSRWRSWLGGFGSKLWIRYDCSTGSVRALAPASSGGSQAGGLVETPTIPLADGSRSACCPRSSS